MPHFQAKIVLLKKDEVPPGYTIEEIWAAMENKQFPLKFRKGGAGPFEIGMVIRAYLGRDAIVADIGFDPEFSLVLDKVLTKDKEDETIEVLTTVVKHVEWV